MKANYQYYYQIKTEIFYHFLYNFYQYMLIDLIDQGDEYWTKIEKLPIVLSQRDYWFTNIFYNNGDNIGQFLSIVNNNSKLSLRIIDWFVTNYSKKNYVIIPVKKPMVVMGEKIVSKTKKNEKSIDLNVFLNYKAQLKAYSKKQFDPFCRRERISFYYKVDKSIITTVGQLNFFKWAIENDIIKYIRDNIDIIDDDMNKNIKKPKTKKKASNKAVSVESVEIIRKKRRELSVSAVKSLNRHNGNIVLSFD